MFELKVEEKDVLLEELQKPWQVQERVMEADMSVLKWVEDLEQRVVSADLHLKVTNVLISLQLCASIQTNKLQLSGVIWNMIPAPIRDLN